MKPDIPIEENMRPDLRDEVRGPEWFEKLPPQIQRKIARIVFIGGPILLVAGAGILTASRPTEESRKRDALENKLQLLSESEWSIVLAELDMTMDELRQVFHMKTGVELGEGLAQERIYTFEQLKHNFWLRFYLDSRTPNAVPLITVIGSDDREYLAIKRTNQNGKDEFLHVETREIIEHARVVPNK